MPAATEADYEREQKRQRLAQDQLTASTNQRSPPIDPMAELADVASRLEPMDIGPTPPLASTSLPPVVAPPAVTAPHHPHHHHHHHHHRHGPSPGVHTVALPPTRGEPMEDARLAREALREDLVRARREIDHLQASVARGERLLEALEAKVEGETRASNGPRPDLEAWMSDPALNSAASVPLKRKVAAVVAEEGIEETVA